VKTHDLSRTIEDLVNRALQRLRETSEQITTDIDEDGTGEGEGDNPEPLDGARIQTIAVAIGTHRPIHWKLAWAMLHCILELQEQVAEIEAGDIDPEEATQEQEPKIAGKATGKAAGKTKL